MSKKSALIYIRAPNLDYEPDKAIRLGHIWKHPLDPGSFCGPPLPIPEDMETNHAFKSPWSIAKGKASGGSLGIWASFLQAVGVTAKSNFDWNNANDVSHTCERLDTYSIEPTKDYVMESVKAVAVDAVKRKQRLFMACWGGARAGFGGESLGVPFDGGPQFTIRRDVYYEETYGESPDFVFAYRIRRIVYPKGGWESTQAGPATVNYGGCETNMGAFAVIGPSAWRFNSRLEFSEGDETEISGPLVDAYPSTWQEVCEGKGSVQDGRAEHKVVVSPEVGYYAGSSGAGNNVSSEIDGLTLGNDRFVLEEYGHKANLISFVDDSWEDGLFLSSRS